MRRTLLFTVAVLVLVSTMAFAAKMPRGSFLKHSVSNATELAAQVTDDGLVASRYAKHFGVSRNIVVACFKDELRVGKLKSNYDAVVYTISGNSDIVTEAITLRAGSYVFVDGGGRPVLEASTGNPLISRLPMDTMLSKSARGAMGSTQVYALPAPTETVTPGVIPQINTGIEPVAASVAAMEGAVIASSSVQTANEAPVVEIVSAIPAPARISRMGAMLPAIAVLGGVAMASGSGDSSVDRSNGGIQTPTPEPSSIAALAMGASALAFGYRRRKK